MNKFLIKINLLKIIRKCRLKLSSIEKSLANNLAKSTSPAKESIKTKNINRKLYTSKEKTVLMRQYFASLSGAVKTEDIIKNFEDWSVPNIFDYLKKMTSNGEIVKIKRGVYRRNLG